MKKIKLFSIGISVLCLLCACKFQSSEEVFTASNNTINDNDNTLDENISQSDNSTSNTTIHGKRKVLCSDDSAKEILNKEAFQKLVATVSNASIESSSFQFPELSNNTAYSLYLVNMVLMNIVIICRSLTIESSSIIKML